MLDVALRSGFRRLRQSAGALPARAARQPKVQHGWHMYLQQYRAEASMRVLAQRWRELSDEQRAHYDQLSREVPPVGSEEHVGPAPPPPPWPYTGDDFYPVTKESLMDVPAQVRELHAQWLAAVGDKPVSPIAQVDAPPERLCGHQWGPSQCEQAMSRGRRAALI
eukprot:5653603-Alexandrium_andersonii.AAC.1